MNRIPGMILAGPGPVQHFVAVPAGIKNHNLPGA